MSIWRLLLLGSMAVVMVGCQSPNDRQPLSSPTLVRKTPDSKPLLSTSPPSTPTPSVESTPDSSESSKASPRDAFGIFGISTKKKPRKKKKADSKARNWSGRGLMVLNDEDKWEELGGPLKPPCVVRTESPTHLDFGNRGKLTLGPDARVAIGKDWATVKILAGVFVLEARGDLITVIDSADRKLELKNGILMVTKYPDRNEYHVVAGEALVKDTMGRVEEQVLGPYEMIVSNGAESFLASWSLGGGPAEMILIFGVLTAYDANPIGMWDNHPALTKVEMPVFGEVALQSQVPTMNVGGAFRRGRRVLNRPGIPPENAPLYRLEPDSLGKDLEERRLSWVPSNSAPGGVDGYYLELRRSSGKELLWATTSEDTSVDIPEYVTLKPGGYDWKVFPVTEKGIVHKQSLGHFSVPSGS